MTRSCCRFAAAGLVAGLSLLLAACLMGKFTSALDLRKDGRSAYSYQGEIYSGAQQAGGEARRPMRGEGVGSPALHQRRQQGRAALHRRRTRPARSPTGKPSAAKAEKDKKDAEMAKAMMAALTLSTPGPPRNSASRPAPPRGEERGLQGRWDVRRRLAIAGRIDHDFAFLRSSASRWPTPS